MANENSSLPAPRGRPRLLPQARTTSSAHENIGSEQAGGPGRGTRCNRFGRNGDGRPLRHRLGLVPALVGAVLIGVVASPPAPGAETPDPDVIQRRAEAAYREARTAHFSHPTNVVAAWEFSRTCFDRAFTTESKPMRAAFAEEGIAAARAATASDPKSAPGWYYLALNVGQLASTRTLGALSLVEEMEAHLLQARALDKSFDHGGPDRTLGLLYRDAPGWPLSVGNRKKARQHLEAAAAIAPDYFENRLNLLESLVDWREKSEALEEYRRTAALLPKARAALTGPEWEASWIDWDARWPKAVKQVRKWLPKEP